MMKEKIKVVIKDPGEPFREEVIDNTLEAMQRIVRGPIECVTIVEDTMIVICNEEGNLRDLPYNCRVMGIHFVGTIIMCGVDGEEFDDYPGE